MGQAGHQGVLGREDHERRPEQGVRPRREDAQLGATRRGDSDGAVSKTISPPSLRPIQLVCWVLIGSGHCRPLKSSSSSAYLVTFRYHWARSRFSTFAPQRQQWRSTPSTCSRGERSVVRTPVDRRRLTVGEAGLQELQEEPLVPPVVVGIRGDDLRLPVERRTHRPQLGGACCRCSTSSSRAG